MTRKYVTVEINMNFSLNRLIALASIALLYSVFRPICLILLSGRIFSSFCSDHFARFFFPVGSFLPFSPTKQDSGFDKSEAAAALAFYTEPGVD